MRYKVKISYDGSAFCGWQIQNDAPSVQESLQKALSTLLGETIAVTGAGRTDTGVNAIGYYAHFDTAETRPDARELCYKLNAILPAGIVVHEVVSDVGEFHSRFDAKARTYMYFIHHGKDPFIANRSWRLDWPLDIEAMNKAASMLLGTKDFSCFEKTGGNNKTSICTISKAEWRTYTPDHVALMGFPAGEYLVFTITADRFLRNMVRAIVGTLVDIGRGKKPVEWMSEVLASKDRRAAGESVPGHALFLTHIDY